MKGLDDQTLEALAELICGDAGPLYRKGWELPLFFSRAGLPCVNHDGTTRKWWTLDRLREFNKLPDAVENIILRIANPREYNGEAEPTNAAIDVLNKLLAIEGLAVELNGVVPQLISRKPGLAPATKKHFVPLDSPDFSHMVNDSSLGTILSERWEEAQKCVDAGTHLSALVMMGSLLEGTLLAVISNNPKVSNCATACPRDQHGKHKFFHDWSLNTLIDVAHKCGWIQADVKDFSHVLRSYRNLIHPWQQRLVGINPDKDTCAICWEVVRAAVNDLAESQKASKS